MHKLSLTFPQEIEEELSLLCLDQPKICKKEGNLGWISNDRIIIIRQGFFEYYNLHSGFVENDPLTISGKHFKLAVPLDFIQEVNYLPKNKIKKTFLELIFPKDRKVTRMPTEAQPEFDVQDGNKAEDELEKWVFEFKIDVKEYVEKQREELKQQKRNMTILEENVPAPSQSLVRRETSLFDSVHKFTEEKEDSHEKDIQEYVNAVQETKQILRNKAELVEQEAARQKKKKERQMAELLNTKNQSVEDEFSITSFWREYFRAYEMVVKSTKEKRTLEEILESEVNLLKLVEYFNTIAVKLVEDYVNEKCIGWEGIKKEHDNFKYYKGLWLKVGGKELNQQFLINYYLNDIFYSLREIKNMKFRLPLMSLLKYKSIKILVMCDLPFSELQKTEVYNLIEDTNDLQLVNKLKENLYIIEDILNVKSQPIEIGERKKISAPLGLHLKIYEYYFNKDKAQDQAILPHFYYLINPGIAFPLDYLEQRNGVQPLARLRPELVAAYRDYHIGDSTQLLTQAFMQSSMPLEFQRKEDEKVIKASKWLESSRIQDLTANLNNIDLLIVDSYSIKKIMEEKGINMRHLHLIYKHAKLPYIREHLLVEALARTIKKEFRVALQSIEDQQKMQPEEFERMDSSERIVFIKSKTEETNDLYKKIAVDYLNLIFGKGQETDQFWKIIIDRCKDYFKLECPYPLSVRPGLLLHAVLWHCRLKAKFKKEIPLWTAEQPFCQSNEVVFTTSVKTFDYPSFEIQKLFRGCPTIEERVTIETFKASSTKLLKLELLFYSVLKFSFESSLAIAKMSNFNQFQTRVEMENPLHPAVIPYYLINKSNVNYHLALEIMNFSLPETHPLTITLHLEYATLLEPALLKKTAVLLAVKNLGEFHSKTTDIYSKFYHQGEDQYYIKVLRAKNIQSCKYLCDEMFKAQRYGSCLQYCMEQIVKMNSGLHYEKLGAGNFENYLSMLMQGLESSIRTVEHKKGIPISEEISIVISSFKFKDLNITYHLFRRILILHMLMSPKKYFLYKMVLFAVHIRTKHEQVELDEGGSTVPMGEEGRQAILEGLSVSHHGHESHFKWVQFILTTIIKSFQYFNFLEDLFNNYPVHIKQYNNSTFNECLGYWDILIRLYGQHFFKSILYDVRLN